MTSNGWSIACVNLRLFECSKPYLFDYLDGQEDQGSKIMERKKFHDHYLMSLVKTIF